MENLKIRVNSEAESKEVQELFSQLGYNNRNNIITSQQMRDDGYSKDYIIGFLYAEFGAYVSCTDAKNEKYFINCSNKEITLPQLRDMVVLKRNDVSDATHTDQDNWKWFISSNGTGYVFAVGNSENLKQWDESSLDMVDLKPIQKEEVKMKEYLRQNSDGTYSLELTSEREAKEPHAKHWIEVPKDCDYLISSFGVNSFIDEDMFDQVKPKKVLWSRHEMKEYLVKENGVYVLHGGGVMPSGAIEIPEGANAYIKYNFCSECGFLKIGSPSFVLLGGNWLVIDSEYTSVNHFIANGDTILWQRESLNDQIASAEKARVDLYGIASQPEPLPFIDDEPCTVDSTLSQRQSQYGDFKDVADTTQRLLKVLKDGESFDDLSSAQLEAVHMICSKMARIVNGDVNHSDNWHDIAGYATLIDKEL